jgi:hypothetical protein
MQFFLGVLFLLPSMCVDTALMVRYVICRARTWPAGSLVGEGFWPMKKTSLTLFRTGMDLKMMQFCAYMIF